MTPESTLFAHTESTLQRKTHPQKSIQEAEGKEKREIIARVATSVVSPKVEAAVLLKFSWCIVYLMSSMWQDHYHVSTTCSASYMFHRCIAGDHQSKLRAPSRTEAGCQQSRLRTLAPRGINTPWHIGYHVCLWDCSVAEIG